MNKTQRLSRHPVVRIVQLACICAVAGIQLGCATIETRFGRPASSVKALFPSTNCSMNYLSQTECDDFRIVIPFALIDFAVALSTDFALLPLDLYHALKHSTKDHRERERFLASLEPAAKP